MSDGTNPFLLVARINVKPDCVERIQHVDQKFQGDDDKMVYETAAGSNDSNAVVSWGDRLETEPAARYGPGQ